MWELQGTCSERNSNDCWASTSSASRISASFFRSFMWLLISANCSAGGAVMHWRGEQVSDRGGRAERTSGLTGGLDIAPGRRSVRDALDWRRRVTVKSAKSLCLERWLGKNSPGAPSACRANRLRQWPRRRSRSSTRSRRGSSRRRARAAPPPNSWSSGDRSAWRSRSSRAAPTRARPTSTSWAARALTWPPHTSQRAPPRRRYATLSVRRRCS